MDAAFPAKNLFFFRKVLQQNGFGCIMHVNTAQRRFSIQ